MGTRNEMINVKLIPTKQLKSILEDYLLGITDIDKLPGIYMKNLYKLYDYISKSKRLPLQINSLTKVNSWSFNNFKSLMENDNDNPTDTITAYIYDKKDNQSEIDDFEISVEWLNIEATRKSYETTKKPKIPKKLVELAKQFNDKFEALTYRVVTGGSTEIVTVKNIKFELIHNKWLVNTRKHKFDEKEIKSLVSGKTLGWSEKITNHTTFRYEEIRGVPKGYTAPKNESVKWGKFGF